MSFFKQIHKSIFDKGFYREALDSTWKKSAAFLLKLLLFTAVALCLSKTYYLLHSERGIAPLVSVLFDGLVIRDGTLVDENDEPKIFNGALLSEVMNRIMGAPRFFGTLPDDFMIVENRFANVATSAAIVLRKTQVEFREVGAVIPYTTLTGGADFRFDTESVQRFLNVNVVAFALSFFVTSLLSSFITMTICVLFLSLAAYLFRIDRADTYKRFAQLAVFAVTPIMLGEVLVSMTGVAVEWAWHVFIVLSTLLMFRLMSEARKNEAGKVPKDKTV